MTDGRIESMTTALAQNKQNDTSENSAIWRSFRSRSFLRGATSFVVIIAIWEFTGRFLLTNHLFLVPFSSVVIKAIDMIRSGELEVHIAASLAAVLYGMILATIAGIMIGIAMGASAVVRDYLEPVVAVLYAMPLVAIAPLLILWFGVGVGSKVAVVFLMAIFPIIINTAAGIQNTDAQFVEVARGFGATHRQIVAKVMIPAAIPFVVTGLRLAVGRAVVGVVVGELFGARAGLGFLIFTAGQTFDTPTLFVGIITLALIGMTLTMTIRSIEVRLSGWKGGDQE